MTGCRSPAVRLSDGLRSACARTPRGVASAGSPRPTAGRVERGDHRVERVAGSAVSGTRLQHRVEVSSIPTNVPSRRAARRRRSHAHRRRERRGNERASRSPSGLARLEPALDVGRAPADAAGGESERLRQITAAPEAPECRQTQADALGQLARAEDTVGRESGCGCRCVQCHLTTLDDAISLQNGLRGLGYLSGLPPTS